jgi:predicted ATPase with chaperone activity
VEYFKGVLIMTTNRMMAFDPAILSRIHHAVNFEETSSEQEKRIWNIWLDRLSRQKLCAKQSEIKDWIEQTTKQKRRVVLSGREIRNVLIVAQTLADREGKSIKITRAHLDRAYKYKTDFFRETEKQKIESKQMMASKTKSHH